MATSGTYAFNPALARLVLASFARIGLRGTQILTEHLSDAEFESNMLLCEWSNSQPNYWLSELVDVPLISGTKTYDLNANFVAIQIAYITQTTGGSTTDRPLGAMSTVEWYSQPNKDTEGAPTAYWFDRQTTPQITVWPVPNSTSTYTLKIRGVRQVQDAAFNNGLTLDIPYRFQTAFVDGLAARLGAVYPNAASAALGPQYPMILQGRADKSWDIASSQDTEQQTKFFITPQFGGYYK